MKDKISDQVTWEEEKTCFSWSPCEEKENIIKSDLQKAGYPPSPYSVPMTKYQ